MGHSLTGLLVLGALSRPEAWRPGPLAAAAVAGAAADLDFLPGLLLGDPSRFHQGITHSLAASLAFGILAGAVVRPVALGPPVRRMALFALLYASHLLLDLFAVDTSVPVGIPLLWPLSAAAVHAPVSLFADVHHGASWAAFINGHNLETLAQETLLFGSVTALVLGGRRRRTPGRGQAGPSATAPAVDAPRPPR